jgi:hypothetical protein
MEDESRPLPSGWLRQYDPQTHHQFFVDTRVEPSRSIWHHPYDDDVYLASLTEHEREEIKRMHRVPTTADLEAESSDEDHDHDHEGPVTGGQGGGEGEVQGLHRFGRKMKDRITGSTHQEREQKRREREAEEQEAYRRHMHIRNQMRKAAETGQPQLLGKDSEGKEVYIEPPYDGYGGGMGGGYGYNPYGGGYGGGMGGMGMGMGGESFGVSDRGGKRYLTPSMPYARPYGGGFGGGYGMPLGMGMPLMGLGGLGGGLMMGSLLF